jgi:hypothetical protein
MRVGAAVVLSILSVSCGETRRPLAIEVQSNDSTLNNDQKSADVSPAKRGFMFINPVTGVEVPSSISIPTGAAIRVSFRLVGVRSDDFTIGFAKGSSPRMRIDASGMITSSNLPAGTHEFQLVARNTRACAASQRSISSESGSRRTADDTLSVRCDISGVEVPALNFELDVATSLQVIVGGASLPQGQGQNSQTGSNSSDLDSRINSQFGRGGSNAK